MSGIGAASHGRILTSGVMPLPAAGSIAAPRADAHRHGADRGRGDRHLAEHRQQAPDSAPHPPAVQALPRPAAQRSATPPSPLYPATPSSPPASSSLHLKAGRFFCAEPGPRWGEGTAVLCARGAASQPPWRQPRGKSIVSFVNSHTNATSKECYVEEVAFVGD